MNRNSRKHDVFALTRTFVAEALFVVAALTTTLAVAETPEEKGLAIAVEAERRDTGFHDQAAELEMILRNRHGEESHRQLRSLTLEQLDDGDKGLVIFDAPADIDGTAFLSFSHRTGNDDQWLYLPALKRVKRIASSNKSGPFVGSEFAYEDISSQEVEEYTYLYLIERYPVDPKSGYTRQVVWIDRAEYRTLKVDFYDRKDDLHKTLTFSGYQQYLDQYWRPDRMLMVNHQTGKSTELIWRNYRFRNGLAERDFDRASLMSAR
jgi:hypothetical protein